MQGLIPNPMWGSPAIREVSVLIIANMFLKKFAFARGLGCMCQNLSDPVMA